MKRRIVVRSLLVVVAVAVGYTLLVARPGLLSKSPSAHLVWESAAVPSGGWGWGALSQAGDQVICSNAQRGLWSVTSREAKPIPGKLQGRSPAWRPGGADVAYAYLVGALPEHLDPEHLPAIADLAILDAATLKVRRVGSPQLLYGSPKWSHSGTQIACQTTLHDTTHSWALALFSYPDLKAKFIPVPDQDAAAGGANAIAWSPDDRQVAITSASARGMGAKVVTVWPLWVVDLGAGSARRVWDGEPYIGILDAGFESDSKAPCFLTQKKAWAGGHPDDPVVLRRVGPGGKVTSPASLVPRRGWLLTEPKLFPDGKGLVAVTANRLDPTPGEEMKAELVWTHAGRTGHIALPAGYTGHILGWSGDGRRLGLSCYNCSEDKTVVYEIR